MACCMLGWNKWHSKCSACTSLTLTIGVKAYDIPNCTLSSVTGTDCYSGAKKRIIRLKWNVWSKHETSVYFPPSSRCALSLSHTAVFLFTGLLTLSGIVQQTLPPKAIVASYLKFQVFGDEHRHDDNKKKKKIPEQDGKYSLGDSMVFLESSTASSMYLTRWMVIGLADGDYFPLDTSIVIRNTYRQCSMFDRNELWNQNTSSQSVKAAAAAAVDNSAQANDQQQHQSSMASKRPVKSKQKVTRIQQGLDQDEGKWIQMAR